MKKLPIIILICVANVLKSQDIHFSQIQESPLWLNPANAGFFNGYVRSIANYRNQWASMGNAFQTMAVSIDAVALKQEKIKLIWARDSLFLMMKLVLQKWVQLKLNSI